MTVHKMLLPALAVALAFAPGLARAASSADDAKVSTLIAQSRTALGGAALSRAGVVRTDLKVSEGGLTGTAQSYAEMGGLRFAQSYVTPPLSGGDGYDGKVAWNRDRSGLVWVDGGLSGRAQEISQAYLADGALWSKDRGGATVAWGGTKNAGGKSYDVLIVTPPNVVSPFEFWFDKTTHLPERSILTLGPYSSTVTFSNYRVVDGMKFPFTQHSESSDGNSGDATIVSVVPNVPGGASHLAKPASDVHDFSMANGATQTTIPFELIDNHVYLDVKLNGKGPYRFIFDSGGLNLIDPAVATEIGAIGKGSVQGGGVGSSTESVSFANVDSLQVGDAMVNKQLFFVAPTRAGFGMSGGKPVDGLIGFEVLARFVTTFDYGDGKVVLAMPGAATPSGADVIPFVFDGQTPLFPCNIDGIDGKCTLDTGSRASVSLYAPFLAAHPQVVPSPVSAIGVNGFGFGGAAMGSLGRLGSLTIGSFQMKDLVGDFTSQGKGALASPFVAANVGGGVWKRFNLTLDYSAQTMALSSNPNYAQRDGYERAGLFLINRNGALVVLDSRPGTPAATAGIAKGDTIVSIDGKPTATMTLQQVREEFFQPSGTILTIELTAADGSKRTVKLTLHDIV